MEISKLLWKNGISLNIVSHPILFLKLVVKNAIYVLVTESAFDLTLLVFALTNGFFSLLGYGEKFET